MRLSRRAWALPTTATLAALLLLTGCGGATPPTEPDSASSEAPATPVDEGVTLPAQTVGATADCSLYDVAELEAVWGVPFVDFDHGTVIETSDGGQLYSCDYNETDSGLGLTFVIEYRDFATLEGAERDMANTRDGAQIGDTVYFVNDEVEGVGDEAFFSLPASQVDNPDNVQHQLYARVGKLVLLVTALNLDGAAPDFRDKILESVALHF